MVPPVKDSDTFSRTDVEYPELSGFYGLPYSGVGRSSGGALVVARRRGKVLSSRFRYGP